MKSSNAQARPLRLPAAALIVTLLALSSPDARAQRQVESVLYGMSDGNEEWLLVNGDSLRVSTFDFYEVGQNAETETATLRCSQHNLRRNGEDVLVAAICTKFFLNGGTEMMLAHADGDRWVSRTLFGTDDYENVKCEWEVRPGTWMSHNPARGAWRWTNHATGTCTEVEK